MLSSIKSKKTSPNKTSSAQLKLHRRSDSAHYLTISQIPQNLKTYRNLARQRKEKQVNLNKSNLELLFERHGSSQSLYPSSFNLISLPSKQKNVTLPQIANLSFPILSYSVMELVEFSTKILRSSSFCSYNFSEKVMRKLVTLVAKNYNLVSYHNFSHGFELMLMNFICFCKQSKLKYLFTQEEYFMILMAGLCHDLNHPGTNNSFEVKMKTLNASLAKNESVLENMHLRHLWKMLGENEELDFISKSQNPFKNKEVVTRLILATDMAFHFVNIQKLREYQKDNQEESAILGQKSKWFLMQQIVHACDIAHPCMTYSNYVSWAALISHEFNEISKQEQSNGLPVSSFMVYHNLGSLYKDQASFVGSIVLPLWKQLSLLFPHFKQMVDNVEHNLDTVTKKLDEF